MKDRPNYGRVFLTFARNSLIRDMTYRANFLIDAFSSVTWVLMNLGFYVLIFSYTTQIGSDGGWGKYQFFVFLSTTLCINSLVMTFVMPNASEFSELIRTGNLDFALIKPIDTQFVISFQKIEWSNLMNFFVGLVLLCYALLRLEYTPSVWQFALYPVYILCGAGILYSLTVAMSSASVWLGRNQSLYDFWFYITNFSRYPREIYQGPFGTPLQWFFTFIIPILIVVNVPARLMAFPLQQQQWFLAIVALISCLASLLLSRWVFMKAISSYRSASS